MISNVRGTSSSALRVGVHSRGHSLKQSIAVAGFKSGWLVPITILCLCMLMQLAKLMQHRVNRPRHPRRIRSNVIHILGLDCPLAAELSVAER